MDDTEQRILDAAEVLAREQRSGITVEALAREAAVEPAQVLAAFGSERGVLRELSLGGIARANDAVVAALEGARSGADAITRFVKSYAHYYEAHPGAFRAAYLYSQAEGRESIGMDQAGLSRAYAAGTKKFDVLEGWLSKDRGPSNLAGGLHPRRLAFLSEIATIGLLVMRGVSRAMRDPFKHSDDDLTRELTNALGASVATVQQLGALNVVATRLASLRLERDLRALVPELLATALDITGAAMVFPAESGSLPEHAAAALRDGGTSHRVLSTEDGRAFVAIATPVRCEGRIEAVLAGEMHLLGPALAQADCARLESFAAMVGLSLENVRLYENLEAAVEGRTRKLREAQSALVQSEKMAAMATLVAGLAHEINTPVASVLGSQQTLARAVARLHERGDDGGRLLATIGALSDTIGRGASRVSEILGALRRFSRLDGAEVGSLDLAEALGDAITLTQSRMPAGATVDTSFAEVPALVCYASRINQVLLNVLLNAAEAVAPGGHIHVATRALAAAAEIVIGDDGAGIAPEHLPRVFDPGFTTKGVGVGAGLGLAVAFQIIDEHRGTISLDSAPGSGTRVTICVPLRL